MSDTIKTTELTEEQSLKVDEILPLLANLQQALETECEGIEGYIKDINDNLREFPELVHLLSDEQIQPIYLAYKQQTGTVIAVKKSKSRKGDKLLDDGRTAGDLL